jgi:hypothetical protein
VQLEFEPIFIKYWLSQCRCINVFTHLFDYVFKLHYCKWAHWVKEFNFFFKYKSAK